MIRPSKRSALGILWACAALLICFGSAPLQAEASTIDVTADWTGTLTFGLVYSGQSKSHQATEFIATFSDPDWGTWPAYCVELEQTIQKQKNTYNVLQVTEGKLLQAAWIMDQYAPGLGYAAGGYSTKQLEAAVQLAIWEIVYETSSPYALGSGSFKVTSGDSGARTLAQSYLDALLALGGTLPELNHAYFKLEHNQRQDLLVATPIPGAAWLLGSGAAFLLVFRRRNRRREPERFAQG